MLGRGQINQRTAQLAAWHLNNDLSWKKLAGMQEKAALGTVARYTDKELQAAKKGAESAAELVSQAKQMAGSLEQNREA